MILGLSWFFDMSVIAVNSKFEFNLMNSFEVQSGEVGVPFDCR